MILKGKYKNISQRSLSSIFCHSQKLIIVIMSGNFCLPKVRNGYHPYNEFVEVSRTAYLKEPEGFLI